MSDLRRPSVLSAGDGESLWFLGSLVTVKVVGDQSHGRLTVVEFVNPPGFAPPLHLHRQEDEIFYIFSGSARFLCDGMELDAAPGDVVVLPAGLAHTFVVGDDEPLRTLQLTTPAGFEEFAREAGEPARVRELPALGDLALQGDADPTALMQLAARHGMEILGPPPGAGHDTR